MPDLSVTSGTGLNPDAGMPMSDWSSWLPEEMPMPNQLFPEFRHLLIRENRMEQNLSLLCSPTNQAMLPLWDSCTFMSYSAASWATMHAPYLATLLPTELHCIPFWAPLYPLSYTATYELCCACILLSYNTPYWAALHPVEQLMKPTELPFLTLLSYAASLWAAPAFFWAITPPVSYTTPCLVMMQPAELPSLTLLSYICYTLLNYAAPSEQCCTLLSHVALYGAMLHLTELRCTQYKPYAAPY